MPAYYSTSILDWSPSSTINLNWLAVGCDFRRMETGENSACLCCYMGTRKSGEGCHFCQLVNKTCPAGYRSNDQNFCISLQLVSERIFDAISNINMKTKGSLVLQLFVPHLCFCSRPAKCMNPLVLTAE